MRDYPSELRLEVKSSRTGAYSFTRRDLDGPGSTGFVVALLNERLLRGPRWVFVPVRMLHPRAYSEAELSGTAELGALAAQVDQEWSDWILDREAWQRLLEPGATGVAERIAWCRCQHPPRQNRRRGNVRENELDALLRAFREQLDRVATGDSGSQVEGQIHQALLKDALERTGYTVLQNPVGVPDIVATRKEPTDPSSLRSRLEAWEPGTSGLAEVRRSLLELGPDDLRRLAEELAGSRRGDAPPPGTRGD